MSTIAIITARGGSKRIPKKNIKSFLGRPILSYAIATATKAECFDVIMVSTDNEEIADVARACGAEVPFLRSAKNADDHAPTMEVLREVLADYRDQFSREFDNLCCIYPAAPFVTERHLRKGLELLLSTDADIVLPVVRYSYPIQRSFRIVNEKAIMLWPENCDQRSQDMEPAYHDAGQFYFLRASELSDARNPFTRTVVPIILRESEVQDIDTEEDWIIAELKYKMLHP